jgi:peptide/nickel transport system permease protein
MFAYVVRRLLQGIPILLGVTLITFLLFNAFGGDPVVQFLGKSASAEDIAALRRAYGFDQPLYVQYLDYLRQIVTLDFGDSFVTKEPVLHMIGRGVGPSLSLTIPALALTTLLAVVIGLAAAYVRGGRLDRGLMATAVLGMSVSFLVYIVVGQYLFAYVWRLFQIHGYESGLGERWQYLSLPIVTMVIVGLGYDARFYRSVFAEEVGRDHVTTAYAKGASKVRIMFVHVLKNAMIPIITRVMISLPFLVTGSLLLETFYGIPGLGATLFDALNRSDQPVIRAYTVMISVLFILSTILNDILYAAVDPRVRLE